MLAGCAGPGEPSGTVILRNESGKAVKSAQVNIVIADTKGVLQETAITDFDQINHVGPIPAGEERSLRYRDSAEYNIDTFVIWADGSTARYNYGYVIDGWGAPTHVITITPTQLLFDGDPPIDVQSEPEKYFDKYRPERWNEGASEPPLE